MYRFLVKTLSGLSRRSKRSLVLGLDAVLCVATVAGAYYLRLGYWLAPHGTFWIPFFLAPVIAIPIFFLVGFYREIFRYSGYSGLLVSARACLIYGLIFFILFTAISVPHVPRTMGIIQPILLFLAIGATRALARSLLGGQNPFSARGHVKKRVLIYGAGSAGRELAAAFASNMQLSIIGFIDDDPVLQGSILAGHRIYPPDNLPALFDRLAVDDVLLALPSVSRKRRNEIIESMRDTSVSVQTLPGLIDLAQGRVSINDLRELDIEDLLGRDPRMPDALLMGKNIAGKTVLVTGAGGSIGSELCRQIFQSQPKALLLVDMNEYNLYAVHSELEQRKAATQGVETEIVPLLASVLDETRMASIMTAWSPDTVYHAAAYKHVPLVEHNPAEGVRNNVFGTLNTAKMAQAAGVKDYVLISTDKAVRPANVMGASKRLAEMGLQALAASGEGAAGGGNTRFSMVRFGNVLGSSGSVVPLFRAQIKQGGPVTITHSDITRYFMTIPEAAQLVIQAGAMAQGGGEVFVLDMGEPVKIYDLARKMIELSGASVRDEENPGGDIEISTVGLRPGEKLYEELLIGNEPAPTDHPLVMKANEKFMPMEELHAGLLILSDAIMRDDVRKVRSQLELLVPEYKSDTEMVDWVHLERRKTDRRKYSPVP
jgi:FlaA1/EpsC-like NDP-sugar epimerase